MTELGIMDVWKELNPKGKDYTFFFSTALAIIQNLLFFHVQKR